MKTDRNFQATVVANQRLGKPAFLVSTLEGYTAELCFDLRTATEFVLSNRFPHLYNIYKRNTLGHMTLARKRDRETGFQLVDLCRIIDNRSKQA